MALALVCDAGTSLAAGTEPDAGFLTGYLIEKSPAVDKRFVFVLILTSFSRHRVRDLGAPRALAMRAILICRFHWQAYVFGAFLIRTVCQMAARRNRVVDVTRSPALRSPQHLIAVSQGARNPWGRPRNG